MKTLTLHRHEWRYSESFRGVETDYTLAAIREALSCGIQFPPIAVISENNGLPPFVILDGNHRALIAEWGNCKIVALLVETCLDFQILELDRTTRWGENLGVTGSNRFERASREAFLAAALLEQRQNKMKPNDSKAISNDQPDMLASLFELQKSLNLKIGVDTDALDESERIKWLLNYARALGQELSEMVDSVPWKWWAKYQKFDVQNVRVEIVDMLHFLISLAQVVGMGPEEIHRAYLAKHEVNVKRQDTGYSVKDAEDSRHI